MPELDEPLLSPKRIGRAIALWAWFVTRTPPTYLPFWPLVRSYRRAYRGRDVY